MVRAAVGGEGPTLTTEPARESVWESLVWGSPAVTPTSVPAFVEWVHDRLGAEPPRRCPGRDPGVPQHPPGPDHPGAGGPSLLRRRPPPGAGTAPGGDGAAGRSLPAVLHPTGARRRHRRIGKRHRGYRPRAAARR